MGSFVDSILDQGLRRYVFAYFLAANYLGNNTTSQIFLDLTRFNYFDNTQSLKNSYSEKMIFFLL